jgi:hypothetical protein
MMKKLNIILICVSIKYSLGCKTTLYGPEETTYKSIFVKILISCLTAEETTDHIMSSCPFAASFWNHVGAGLIHIAPVRELWDSSLPTNITQRSSPTFLLLCCWELWKHRNAVVFNGMPPSLSRLLAACRESANTWKCRVPVSKRHEFDSWCILFQM